MDESKHTDEEIVFAGAGSSTPPGGSGGVTSRGFSFRVRRSDQRAIFRAARGLVS